jgi:hypothetical protein
MRSSEIAADRAAPFKGRLQVGVGVHDEVALRSKKLDPRPR